MIKETLKCDGCGSTIEPVQADTLGNLQAERRLQYGAARYVRVIVKEYGWRERDAGDSGLIRDRDELTNAKDSDLCLECAAKRNVLSLAPKGSSRS